MGLRADGHDRDVLRLQRLDQSDEFVAFCRVFQAVVVVAEDRIRIRFVGVFEGLGDEVRPDDLRPERVPQDVRAAVGDGLVHDVPDLDLALVAADNGVDVIVHPLEQLLAGRAWSVETAATETAAKSAAASPSPAAFVPDALAVGRPAADWSREHPVGRLAVPDERVSHDIHVVAQAEVHIRRRPGQNYSRPRLPADG